MRAALHQAGALHRWWAKALRQYSFLYNAPKPPSGDLSPLEKRFGALTKQIQQYQQRGVYTQVNSNKETLDQTEHVNLMVTDPVSRLNPDKRQLDSKDLTCEHQ